MANLRHKHPIGVAVGTVVCDRYDLTRLGLITAISGDPVANPWKNILTVRWDNGRIVPACLNELWDPDSVIASAQDKVARLAAQHAVSRTKLHS